MTITTAEVTSFIASIILPFVRIGAAVGIAPIFGARTVPMRIKAAITVILTLIIIPSIPAREIIIDPFNLNGATIIFHQIVIGSTIGFLLHLIFAAVILAGQRIATAMGLGFASMVDPSQGTQVPVVSQFYLVMTTLLFLTMNGHLHMIKLLSNSFITLPIGDYSLSSEKLWLIIKWSSQMFNSALLIALPAITALLLTNITFGVVARSAPQLNVFAVGFPVTILMGFIIIYLTINILPMGVDNITNSLFKLFNILINN